jgi:hypothetical protein
MGSIWVLKDLQAQFNRKRRQARGKYENRALREHVAINRKLPETLPETAQQLALGWMRSHPMETFRMAIRNPFAFEAIFRMNRSQDWSLKTVPPQLVATLEI